MRMPQKQVFEAIKDLEEMDEENHQIEDTDSIYRLLAAVLNNNMGKVPVKAEDVEDYDIEVHRNSESLYGICDKLKRTQTKVPLRQESRG